MKLFFFMFLSFIIFAESMPTVKMKPNVSKDSGLKDKQNLEKLKQGFLYVILGLMRNKRSYAIQGVSTSRSGEYSSAFQSKPTF